MANIVGALAVELGLDTAQFETSLKSLPGMAQKHFGSFSAEARRNTREGAEGLRIFDEAFGIHISRPIARIIAQDFPSLSKAFASVLTPLAGIGVGIAIFGFISDGFGKIGKAADDAKKKEEEFIASTHALEKAVNEESISAANSLDHITEKLAELSGDKSGALEARLRVISREDAEQVVHAIDAIGEAYQRTAKAAADAESASTKFWLFVHSQTTGAFDKANEKITKQAGEIRAEYSNIVEGDPLHGMEKGAEYLKQQLQEAKTVQQQMHTNELSAVNQFLAGLTFTDDIVVKRGAVTKEEVKNYDALVASLQKQLTLTQQFLAIDKGNKKVAGAESADQHDIGEKQIEKLKSETEAELALAGATSKTTAEQKLQQAAGEADQIISRIQEQAHGRLSKAMKEELLSVQALTAERLVAKDAVATNQELEKQIDAVTRQTEASRELAAAYVQGGAAIEAAKIDQRLAAQIQEADKLRAEYNLLKKAADDYAASVAKLGSAAGPKPGLDISPERIASLKAGVDNADSKVAQLRTGAAAEDQAKYQAELQQTARALADEQPYLDRLNAAYGENAEAVRHAQVALQLFHFEQAHPGATPEQIEQGNALLNQQSVNQQRAADAQLAAHYNIVKSYDDEIARLERAREVLQQYGQDTLAIDAAIFDERQKQIKQWDDAALKVGSFKDKYQAVMNELVIEGQNAGEKIANSFLGAIHSSEDELAKFLTGQKVEPQKIVQNLAEQVTKAQIEKFTGAIAGAFGIEIKGPEGRPDGSSEKPLHVTLGSGKDASSTANPLSDAAKAFSAQTDSGGGFFSRLKGGFDNLLQGHKQEKKSKEALNVIVMNAVSAMILNWPQLGFRSAGAAITGTPASPLYTVTSTPEGTPVGASAGTNTNAGLTGLPSPAYSAFLAKQAGFQGPINWADPSKNITQEQIDLGFSQNTPFGPNAPFGGPRPIGAPNIFNSSTEAGVRSPFDVTSGIGAGTGFGRSDAGNGVAEQSLSKAGSDLDRSAQPLSKAGSDLSAAAQTLKSSASSGNVSGNAGGIPSSSGDAGNPDFTQVNDFFSDFGGGLAGGGTAKSGTTYMVGEKGPELFRSSSTGSIIPNSSLPASLASPGSGMPTLIPGGNAEFTFNPHAAYAQNYERYERWLHRGETSGGGLLSSLGLLGGLLFQKSGLLQRFENLFHHSTSPGAIAAGLPAQSGVLNELNSLTASASGSSLPSPSAQAGIRDELSNLTAPSGANNPSAVAGVAGQSPSSFSGSSNPPLSALPNLTKRGDVDAGYLSNWAREYTPGAGTLSNTAMSPSSAALPSPSAQPPSSVNLPEFSSTSDFAVNLDGFRATGGPVGSGKSYMVGERGPELFRPEADGHILPNHMLHLLNNPQAPAMPAGVSDFAGFMADGGDVFAGRSYMVGERGREAYNFPASSNINSSSDSRNQSRSSSVHNNTINLNGDKAVDLYKRTPQHEFQRMFSRMRGGK